MHAPRAMVLALALIAAGCPESRFTLTVRLQSGLRAGHEVRFVEGRLYRGSVPCATDASPLQSSGRALGPGDQGALASGSLALTTFESLEPGLYTVRARFRRPPTDPRASSDSGPVLVERCLVTSLSSDRIVRIALTSDCLEVTCPAPAGSPAFDQCLNGRCVDPRCDPDDPSTAELCCDRAALGDACDTDPTLCAAASDCTGTLACAQAPRCEDGVCVEPETDSCPAGEYCDASARMCVMEPPLDTMDAGVLDASVPPMDAPMPDAYRDDAFVPPGTDADLDAAPEPDVFALPDAFTLADAYAPPGIDAFVGIDAFTPDAGVVPDAYRAPDAWVDTGGENCTNAIDDDSDNAVDCEDTSCDPHPDCSAVRCVFSSISLDPADDSLPLGPVLWWRGDTNLRTVGGTEVCGWGDGIRGLALRPTSSGRAPTRVTVVGGRIGVQLDPADVLTVFDGAALAAGHARTIIVVAEHVSGGVARTFVTSATNREAAVGVLHDMGYVFENTVIRARGAGPYATGLTLEYLGLPASYNVGTAELRIAGMTRALVDTMEVPVAHAPSRHWIGSRASTATLVVAEVLVYDRQLLAGERLQVQTYVNTRYGIAFP